MPLNHKWKRNRNPKSWNQLKNIFLNSVLTFLSLQKIKKKNQLDQSASENRDEHVKDMKTDALTIANDNHVNDLPMSIASDSNNNVTCIKDTSIHEGQNDNINFPTNYVGKNILHIWD